MLVGFLSFYPLHDLFSDVRRLFLPAALFGGDVCVHFIRPISSWRQAYPLYAIFLALSVKRRIPFSRFID